MRLNRIGYLIREGFRSIATHSFMSFASVTIIMACLIIMGSVSLLSVNINQLIKDLESQNEVVAFVDDSISEEEQARAIESSLLAVPNIESVDFVDRGEAMDNFMSQYDDDLMEGIDETVFRHRYVIKLQDIALMAQSKAALENVEGIAKVKAHIEYADAFITVRNIVSIVSLALIVMLVFVSIFIMTNTIKLATFSRREEIGIMKMVGASNGFIRMPYIIEGLILGGLGGSLAFFAEWGLYTALTNKLVDGFNSGFITLVPFETLAMTILTAFVGTGVIVGIFGGINAIKNYLKV